MMLVGVTTKIDTRWEDASCVFEERWQNEAAMANGDEQG
jgi:hypothetical protein